MSSDWIPVIELRERGLAALIRELGPSNALRFLSLFRDGQGDYTRERDQWLAGVQPEDLARLVDRPSSAS